MNERIKELEKETWKEVAQLRTVKWTDWRDKFAELIVKECANVVKNFYLEDELTCYSAAEEIKDHFGIEE